MLLARTVLFHQLEDGLLTEIGGRCRFRRYRKREIIFHQQDPADTLFVVAHGLVKVFVTSKDGLEVALATLRPPDTLGELAVIDEGPRSASAQALDDTTLLSLRRDDFLRLLKEHPTIDEALHRVLGLLVRRILEQASDLVFLDLAGRVAKLLVQEAQRHGSHQNGGLSLDLHLTQGNLASRVGGSRPSVNQILKSFEAKGYLEIEGKGLVIKNMEALQHRGGS